MNGKHYHNYDVMHGIFFLDLDEDEMPPIPPQSVLDNQTEQAPEQKPPEENLLPSGGI